MDALPVSQPLSLPVVTTADGSPPPLFSVAAPLRPRDESSRDTRRPSAAYSPPAEKPPEPQPTQPELLPARMLNEYAYCPRLAYYEWVQGEFAHNLETLEGRFGHRNVDKPTRAELPTPSAGARGSGLGEAAADQVENKQPGKPEDESFGAGDREKPPVLHHRSVELSAPREGVIAKLDLIDLSSAQAMPVDYKRGKAPDLPEGAWEPERVQLCAQALILRENGYHCEAGVLYFMGSKKRVTIPIDDELVDRTRELIAAAKAMAAVGKIPPPLVDSRKCPRCSLVGICLPDETNLLAHYESSGESRESRVAHTDANADGDATGSDTPPEERQLRASKIRRLQPTADNACPLYVQQQGAYVGKSGDEITIKEKGKLIGKARLMDVSQICLIGNAQISSQAMRELCDRGIPVLYFSYGGWLSGVTQSMIHKNVELRIAQYAAAANPAISLPIAKAMIAGKIKNCRTLLRRHMDADTEHRLPALADSVRTVESAPAAEILLGMEGNAAKVYFAGFATLLKGDSEFDLTARNRRPPKDPVNAILSFLYALLVKDLTVATLATGFDPMLGLYHQPRYGRPSLALDLAEEFRPLIADSVALTVINNGEVNRDHFLRRGPAVILTAPGRKAVLAAFERRMESLVTHPIFGYRISYRKNLFVQARLLGRVLTGEIPSYPAFCTR